MSRSDQQRPEAPSRTRFAKSLAAKLAIVSVLFLVVPIVLYGRFQAADDERRAFMLDSIRNHGTAIAQALANDLGGAEPDVFPEIAEKLRLFEGEGIRLRLLYSPGGADAASDFFYVATAPVASEVQLEEERRFFKQSGLLSDVWSSCSGMVEMSRLATSPEATHELIVSITPIKTAQGCWVLIASLAEDDPVSASLVEPYWMRPEVAAAAVIYMAMASVFVALLIDLRVGLRRFERLARTIADGTSRGRSFQRMNQVPELDGVARQFDAMVGRLNDVAMVIRTAAEEQVHAMKTPIGTISQSLEALRPAIPEDNQRARRMLEIIDQSRQRLSSLIVAGQRATEAAAQLAAPPREPVAIDALLRSLCEDFTGPCEARGIHLKSEIAGPAVVLGNDEMLETVLENVIENAVGFSPANATVIVTLAKRRGRVRISVRDLGPGAAPDVLAAMFEKGFSKRPASAQEDGAVANFGFGLWIVHRNVEALGGSVSARNVPPTGLEIIIDLPLHAAE